MRFTWLVLLGLIWAAPALAVDTYVSTTGNNANACGAGIGSPKRNIQSAVNSCGGAGNRVIVRNGAYPESVEITTAGATGNPFTLMAENNHGAILDGPASGQGEMSWGIEITVCNVIVDGFEIKEYGGLGGQAAGVGMRNCNSNTSVTEVRNNWIHHISGVDNPAGVKFALGDYRGTTTVYNNEMTDSQNAATAENNVGVMYFGDGFTAGSVVNLTIRNNKIHNMGTGVAIKHHAAAGTVNLVVEKNLIYDVSLNTSQQVASCVYTTQRNVIIRMNICYNHLGSDGGGYATWDTSSDANGTQIINNCFFGGLTGVRFGLSTCVGCTIRDNILQADLVGARMDQSLAFHNPTMNRDNDAGAAATTPVQQNFGSTVSFATLQAGGRELQGRTGATGWVNPPTDFHLTAGSLNKGAGTGGNDIGCYPTGTEVIGVTSGGGDTVPPSAPTNLRIS